MYKRLKVKAKVGKPNFKNHILIYLVLYQILGV